MSQNRPGAFWRPNPSDVEQIVASTDPSGWGSASVAGYNLLTAALLVQDFGLAAQLLARGFDVNGNNPGYVTSALSEMCRVGEVDAVAFLLRNSANPNGHNIEDEAPLHCAIRHNEAMIVRILLACGANPMQPDLGNRTPVETCAKNPLIAGLIQRIAPEISHSRPIQ